MFTTLVAVIVAAWVVEATQLDPDGHVARILGILGGTGDAPPGGGLEVRLVR